MLNQTLDCIVDQADGARPLWAIRPGGLEQFLTGLPPAQALYLRQAGFRASAGELVLLPGDGGVAGAVAGLGDDRSPFAFGGLGMRLPEGTAWRLEPGGHDAGGAAFGYCIGAYRFRTFKDGARAPAVLVAPDNVELALSQARAVWMVRDLINTPANLLGPSELAAFAIALGERHGARTELHEGGALARAYPTIAAVGAGSSRDPKVAVFHWSGGTAAPDAPLVSLCGKGVCFDTGGYDLKPSAGMLRMKKDMGGAASVLGLASMIMEANLPVRLAVRVGCVENSVSGTAMLPSDVVRTRAGISVEIGNTDAEGRLVLCDLLHEASEARPALLIDCATLTGAARVALGPDLPALFCNDETWAGRFPRHGTDVHDPVWRLPLWPGYNDWLNSPVADMNNVSSRPLAGAIVAALFLQRFVAAGVPWAHFDLYAWNDQARPGRPEGGEAQAIRAIFSAIQHDLCDAVR
jgi:leucyl aminopeptidase